MVLIRKKSATISTSSTTSRTKNIRKVVSKSKRCGLIFPVARVQRLLKTSKLARCPRISVSAAAYLAAVLEYLTSEIVDLAGNVAKSTKRKTITPRFIMLAATSDAEILKMLPNVTFPFSGVTPFINSALLTKPTTPKPAYLRPNPSQSRTPKKLITQTPTQSNVLHKLTLGGGSTLEIVRANIAELTVDAIVNPTNASLYMGGMVGSCLIAKGGPAFAQLMVETARKGPPLTPLAARLTEATGLNCGHVIHVNGPTWDAGHANERLSDLETCLQNVFNLAIQNRYSSIALPSIGSGRSRFPKAIAAETIVSKIKQILTSGVSPYLNVKFVLFDQESIDCYAYEINRTA